MRCFIAIELPEPVKATLTALIGRLRQSEIRATWVKPDAMHLTLRFLGDVDRDAAGRIEEHLRASLLDVKPFELTVAGVGCFPNMKRPSVIWAGVQPLAGVLTSVQSACEKAAQAAGLSPETKTFRPHLTIARVKDVSQGEMLAPWLAREQELACAPFLVQDITLFESQLTPRGPVHTRLREFNLT